MDNKWDVHGIRELIGTMICENEDEVENFLIIDPKEIEPNSATDALMMVMGDGTVFQVAITQVRQSTDKE